MGQPVMAWQIVTRQPDKLHAFYTALFDWEINANNAMGYRVVDTGLVLFEQAPGKRLGLDDPRRSG